MFNVVPQWHPLRLAEDFSTLHNLSGGRAILGVGRGTVPREVLHLNEQARVDRLATTTPTSRPTTTHNREVFEEAMDDHPPGPRQRALLVPRQALRASPARHPRSGLARCRTLTLVPRPRHPYEIWQAVTQPADPRVRARRRPRRRVLEPALQLHQALLGHATATRYAEHHDGAELAPGDKRMLVVAVRVEDTYEEALRHAPRRATTSSGSSSGPTAGAGATWATTASRPSPG